MVVCRSFQVSIISSCHFRTIIRLRSFISVCSRDRSRFLNHQLPSMQFIWFITHSSTWFHAILIRQLFTDGSRISAIRSGMVKAKVILPTAIPLRSSMCGGLSRTSFIHSIATCFDHPYHLIFASILKQYRVHRRIITDNRRIKISWLLLSQSDSIYRLCRPIPSYLLSGNMILEAALCRIVAYRRFSFRSSNIFLLIMSCSSGDSWCCTWWFNRE